MIKEPDPGQGAIVITGASSGIGAALAIAYAQYGTTLAISGRDGERLAAVAELCRSKGAAVLSQVIDVTDRDGMTRWIMAVEAHAPIALMIANAGISAGTGLDGETEDQARAIFSVNLDGVLNSVLPVIPLMRSRRHGQIAIISSLASFRGFPGAPAYCGSKAAVRVWGEGLRGWLAADRIGVSVVCPGFVTSRMTAKNTFPMPFMWSAEKAAMYIRRGLARNRARISFPWPMVLATWLLSVLSPGLVDGVIVHLPKKT
jgi:short-subunit dehydrogenase